jgi:hypothetical protein
MMVEDRQHLFFDCPAAQNFWQRTGILTHQQPWQDVWNPPHTPNLPHFAWPTIFSRKFGTQEMPLSSEIK